MAVENNTERESQTGAPSDHEEQSPLLQDQRSDHEQDADQDIPELKRRRASWYIWRVVWAIFAALVLAVFIKGWVDAGDVNVSSTYASNLRLSTNVYC